MASEPNKEGLEILLERIQNGKRRAAENEANILRLQNDKFEVMVQTISEVNTKLRNQIKLIGQKLEVFDNNITQNDLLLKLKLNQLDKKMNNFIATNEDVLSNTEDILDSEKSAPPPYGTEQKFRSARRRRPVFKQKPPGSPITKKSHVHFATIKLGNETKYDHELPEPRILTLMESAFGGFLDNVQLLLSKGANVNQQDQQLDTPLHHAVRGNNLDVVRVLVESGADTTLRNMRHCTALDEAKMPDIVSFLITN